MRRQPHTLDTAADLDADHECPEWLDCEVCAAQEVADDA